MFDLLLNILPLVLKKQLVIFQVESCHFAEEKHLTVKCTEMVTGAVMVGAG